MNKRIAIHFIALMTSIATHAAAPAPTDAPALSGRTIGEVATNLVQLASAGDAAAFANVLQSSVPAADVLAMIQRSGMLTNHASRLHTAGERARLDYHSPAQRTHFQVELARESTVWRVKQIFLCR